MKKMVTLGAALALLALSCGDEEGVTPQEPDRLAPTSPANVLENVELAFNNRDVDLLKAMLSTNFIFYFDPDDVGQRAPGSQYEIPESWSYTEFCTAAESMLEKAYSLSFTIYVEKVGSPPAGANKYRAEGVKLRFLLMVDELNGYLADQGYFNFEFERYEAAGGKSFWRLVKWWDFTAYPYGDQATPAPASFGKALALYFKV
jgi:hypothetical protein